MHVTETHYGHAVSLHATEAHGQAIPASSKLLLVELEGFGDSKVGAVMDKLESKKASYVAFYTSSQPSNSRVSYLCMQACVIEGLNVQTKLASKE